ncbi:hypothetical protein G4B88_024900 [Cannabis sativa]|uniref:Cupin type-1 domain-containing protein n=1 Tax=Cannabis sativa TaxID=3483 RepID=A0A7J6G9H8_CANSA|nr:hypothetical protein G4B88_024900 [Cannabis sativa]
MKKIHIIFLVVSILFSTSNALTQDFCVADVKASDTPAAFHARTPLMSQSTISCSMASKIDTSIRAQFPGLNGLGLSMARLDLAPKGVIPFHTHPAASEILVV